MSLGLQEEANGARGFLDSVFAVINAESLTDAEFETITLETPAYDRDTYLALRTVLEARDGVSDQVKKLKLYFIAKGVDVNSTPTIPKANSNIFIGSGL